MSFSACLLIGSDDGLRTYWKMQINAKSAVSAEMKRKRESHDSMDRCFRPTVIVAIRSFSLFPASSTSLLLFSSPRKISNTFHNFQININVIIQFGGCVYAHRARSLHTWVVHRQIFYVYIAMSRMWFRGVYFYFRIIFSRHISIGMRYAKKKISQNRRLDLFADAKPYEIFVCCVVCLCVFFLISYLVAMRATSFWIYLYVALVWYLCGFSGIPYWWCRHSWPLA